MDETGSLWKEGMSMETANRKEIRNAVLIGSICSVSYFVVYLARNILSAVTPQMMDSGYGAEFFSSLSSVFFVTYAIGQLINGLIGDKIKARYMMSFGLALAGVCCILFPLRVHSFWGAHAAYGATGFFLSMIYAPMTKVIAENTEPVYATRCSLGCTFAAFFGSPFAGAAAAFLAWQPVFFVSAGALLIMGILCFFLFLLFEQKGIIRYNQYEQQNRSGRNIKLLFEYKIVKFTLISVITGIIRTTVVFWMPTYFSQHLGFTADQSAGIYTAASLVIALSAFVSVFVYEKLGRDLDRTLILSFSAAAGAFLLTCMIDIPFANITFFVLAVFFSNCAATMLWSKYCPSLRDTGMVSSATGFLDFMSYMAAAGSSAVFAGAVDAIGWKNLILICAALMVLGTVISLSRKR